MNVNFMKDVTICVNSYRRSDRLITHTQFPIEILKHKNFITCVEEFELSRYKENRLVYHTFTVPNNSGLSKSRQIVLEKVKTKYLILMDDDLTFSYRRGDELYLTKINDAMCAHMIKDICKCLKNYVHVGISAREGNNRIEDDFSISCRMMRVLAYDVKAVRKLKCRFDRVWFKQDFDMTLQLLEKGCENIVLYTYAQNQSGGSNTKGGCSGQRTKETMRDAAAALKKLHPDFVEVVVKKTKSSWGGGERTDVKVYWKKAFNSSLG